MQPTSPLVRQSVLYQGWPRARVNYFFPLPAPFPRLISTFSTFPLSLLLTQSSNINILTNLISFLFRILKFYLQFQTFLSDFSFKLFFDRRIFERRKRERKNPLSKIYTGELRIRKKKRKGKNRLKQILPSPSPLLPPRRNNLRVRKGRGGENGRNEELNDACPPRPTESRCRINSRNSLWGGGEERRG